MGAYDSITGWLRGNSPPDVSDDVRQQYAPEADTLGALRFLHSVPLGPQLAAASQAAGNVYRGEAPAGFWSAYEDHRKRNPEALAALSGAPTPTAQVPLELASNIPYLLAPGPKAAAAIAGGAALSRGDSPGQAALEGAANLLPSHGPSGPMMAAPIVYHMTKPGSAAAIIREQRMVPKENGLFFSDRPFSEHTSGYGTAAVRMDVPEERLRLDDEFPSGEKHFRVEAGPGVPVDVSEWLARGADRSAPHPNMLRNWDAMPASRDPMLGRPVSVPGGQRGVVIARNPAVGGSSNHILHARLEDGSITSMPQTWRGWRFLDNEAAFPSLAEYLRSQEGRKP